MPPRREVYGMELKPTFGPSKPDESKFPTFRDGDVLIITTGSRQYQLHKSILANCSPLFKEILSTRYTAVLTKKAMKKGAVITNMVFGVPNDDAAQAHLPDITLAPVKITEDGRNISDRNIGLDLENGMPVPPVYKAWDRVLGAFYHRPIELSNLGECHLLDVLPNAVEVLKVAEYLGCVSMITQHFEATLLAMGQIVHRAIANDPCSWIDLSIRMQSKTFYRESLIHAAGQYNTPEFQQRFQFVDPDSRERVTQMAQTIVEKVKQTTSLMLSYYPIGLMRAKSIGLADKEMNSRNSYSNDILHWMALTVFRQWVGHQIMSANTQQAGDLGHDFMRAISLGGRAYLTDFDLESWHELFPMSARGRHVIETKLDEIKTHVTFWAHKFFQNNSKLDVGRFGGGYFTFQKPLTDRYPWIRGTSEWSTHIGRDEDLDDSESEGSCAMHTGNVEADERSSTTTMDEEEDNEPDFIDSP